MTPEQQLWADLRPFLKSHGFFSRVENRVGEGMPDVNGLLPGGIEFWIELKQRAKWATGRRVTLNSRAPVPLCKGLVSGGAACAPQGPATGVFGVPMRGGWLGEDGAGRCPLGCRPAQVAWHTRRAALGGLSFVLVRVQQPRVHLLLPGAAIAALAGVAFTEKAITPHAVWTCGAKVDIKGLITALRAGHS